MSLDIYLYKKENEYQECECVCEACGHKHETFERKHFARFNLTHNLGKMANEAGLYNCLWRADEHEIYIASQMIPLLKKGLKKLIDDPTRFEAYNPSNGWGSYENLVEVVKEYLEVCEKNPDALIEVCR